MKEMGYEHARYSRPKIAYGDGGGVGGRGLVDPLTSCVTVLNNVNRLVTQRMQQLQHCIILVWKNTPGE